MLFEHFDVDGNGQVTMPEFVGRLMPEAYDTHKRHAFSYLQDSETREKESKEAIQHRQAKYKSLAFCCSEEEVPQWQKTGKAAKKLQDFVELLQQKIQLKTSRDSDQLRQAFNLLGGNQGPITEDSLKIKFHMLGLMISEEDSRELFGLLDADGNGSIDFYEFITGIMPTDYGSSPFNSASLILQERMRNKKRAAARRGDMDLMQQVARQQHMDDSYCHREPSSGRASPPPPKRVPYSKKIQEKPIFAAVRQGEVDSLALLTLKSAGGVWGPEALGAVNSCGETPLHLAAALGHIDVIKFVLQMDADGEGVPGGGSIVHHQDHSGLLPSQTAQRHGNMMAMKLLKKADKRASRNKKRGASSLSPSPARGGGSRSMEPPLPSSRLPTSRIEPFMGRRSHSRSPSRSSSPQKHTGQLPRLIMPGKHGGHPAGTNGGAHRQRK